MMILDYVPAGWQLRPVQRKLLLELEAAWDKSDVLVVTAPTAVGKTLLAMVVARWQAAQGQKTNILVPQNILVHQMHDTFPETTVLHKRDTYDCVDASHGLICRCAYDLAKSRAQKSRIRLLNYWTYLANRIYAPVAIFDESHQVIDMLNGLKDIDLRQSLYKYPGDLKIVADLIKWIQLQLAVTNPNGGHSARETKLIETLRKIMFVEHDSIVVYKASFSQGISDVTLSVQDLTVAAASGVLWPEGTVRKILMMSATTGPQDIKEMGLDHRRVTYLECESPIPPVQRPFIYEPAYSLARDSVKWGMPVFATKVLELLERHPEKGLIHLPYSLAVQFRALCDHPRLLFHDNKNKAAVLKEFQGSSPEDGKVLVASGLYEGVDLPYDAARWQLIGKVPYLSLAEPRIAEKADLEPDYYAWETAKRVIQAYGRIVRAPDDYGVTYCCDSSFGRLWRDDEYRDKPMFPAFFRAAFKEKK